MTRVRSQKIRQFLLVTGDPLDPAMLLEKIQLFNTSGEPLMIGVTGARETKIHTTAALTAGAVQAAGLEVAPGWRAFKLSTNRPARVRVYETAAHRDADISRPVGTKPTGNHGRLLEVVTTSSVLEYTLSPSVDMNSVAAGDDSYFITVTNLDTVTGVVTVTFQYLRTE